ncbi:hypothetical protein [Nitrosopumilus sp.]|uniref:hypothetical protein n=1 Tax=Nitrosopumilus sp. TaxID=2024843 RepID=UPI00247F10C8|nr:hypothetical protein [Nitrosopumilus sp.]MCV0430468.1 hypothetical protein [Nitrosopumilus sp.]
MDEIEESEWYLLQNYRERILPLRGILLNLDFTSIEKYDEGTLELFIRGGKKKIKFNEESEKQFKSIIQTDIISKLMMLVEDAVIFMESRRRNVSFYSIVTNSDIDVGLVIKEFFENLEKLSTNELWEIMSYVDVNSTNWETSEDARLVEKYLTINISEMRRLLSELKEFSTTNHPLFKRFKHAGFPVFPAVNSPKSLDFMKNFDHCSAVLMKENILDDVVYVPYSDDVIKSYHIIASGLQKIIHDIVNNRIITIERQTSGMLPNVSHDSEKLSVEEWNRYGEIRKKFYEQNPLRNDLPRTLNLPKPDKENMKWYCGLDDFLTRSIQFKESQNKEMYRLNASTDY